MIKLHKKKIHYGVHYGHINDNSMPKYTECLGAVKNVYRSVDAVEVMDNKFKGLKRHRNAYK